jgi:kinesin family protein 11
MRTAGHSTETLRAEVKAYHNKEHENMTAHSERIDQQLQHIQDSLRVINAKDDASAEAISIIQSAVRESQDAVKSSFAAWSDGLRRSSQALCNELHSMNQTNFAAVGQILNWVFRKLKSASSLKALSWRWVLSLAQLLTRLYRSSK